VKFGRHFVGYIHKDHLSAPWDTPQDYSVGDDLLARVLYVLPTVKFVYLSLKKELCDPEANSAPSPSVKIGSIVKEAKVRDFDVLMALSINIMAFQSMTAQIFSMGVSVLEEHPVSTFRVA